MGLRLAEAGLRGPPHVARMVLFVTHGGPPPRGGPSSQKCKEALREHEFQNMMGDNASAQPGRMQEVLVHETAVWGLVDPPALSSDGA